MPKRYVDVPLLSRPVHVKLCLEFKKTWAFKELNVFPIYRPRISNLRNTACELDLMNPNDPPLVNDQNSSTYFTSCAVFTLGMAQ